MRRPRLPLPDDVKAWPRRCCAIGWCCGPRPTSKGVTTDHVVADIVAAVEVPK